MKALLTMKPVLWFLFLFNLVAVAVIHFVYDDAPGFAVTVGMGLVSVKAGVALLAQGLRQRAKQAPEIQDAGRVLSGSGPQRVQADPASSLTGGPSRRSA
ncbi:hypothetical protein [Nonomuraea sp. NPDC005650]|uniref:hypothetical protein n=1 Tax=Nonomuraea sp. NPDC005650 TaxID=3157045 RepID=UPI0033A9417E